MSVFPSRAFFPARPDIPQHEEATAFVSPALLSAILLTLFGLSALAAIEPFRYEGAGRHVAFVGCAVAYLLVWKEVFRRYLE